MLLSLIPESWKFIIGAALVASIVGLAVYERQSLLKQGAQEATQKIEEANDHARAQADVGSQAVDACYSHSGVWDRSTGVCGGTGQ